MHLSLLLALYASVALGDEGGNATVDLGCNKYEGISAPKNITKWLGMRYAAAPLGELRFMPPEDPPCSDAVQVADEVRSKLPPTSIGRQTNCIIIPA